MIVTDQMKEAVEGFFSTLPPVPDDYRHSVFTYLAVMKEEDITLLRGSVMLGTDPNVELKAPFSTTRVRAGQISLNTLGRSLREFVDDALIGSLMIGGEIFRFPEPDAPGNCAVWPIGPNEPPSGLPFWRRQELRIASGPVADYFRHPDLFWELRRSTTTFDNLAELAQAYGLEGLSPAHTIELVSPHLAEIDVTSSARGGTAELVIALAPNVPRDRLLVTYRAFKDGAVAARGVVAPGKIAWTEHPHQQIGRAYLGVPEPAALQAYVSYGDVGQHTSWVVDRSTVYNEARLLYEVADPNLGKLRKFLFEDVRKSDQRQLESTIGCLAWMLGFGAGHIGGVPGVTDFADLVLTTDSGHVVVFECTTSTLKAQNKLSNLNGRRNIIREKTAEIDQHRKVLGCILTPLSRAEVYADLQPASELGLLVITVDDFERWIEQTRIPQSADVRFAVLEMQLQAQVAEFLPPDTNFPNPSSWGS